MHDAENVGEEPSLHITVGLITKTWADLLLESISELALSEPGFRSSLPAGFAAREFDREQARAHFNRLTRLIAEKASMDSAFDLLADNFLRARRPNTAGVIASAQSVKPGDRFRRRRFVPWNVADDDGKLVLIGPGGDLDFKAEDGDALDVALSGATFSDSDLACAAPLDLIKTLWAAGYLERLEP
jgi:bifunctional lysine-specific demethylase and histidyl-hydroxylase NO66